MKHIYSFCLLAIFLCCCATLRGQDGKEDEQEKISVAPGLTSEYLSWKNAEPFSIDGGISLSTRFYNAWNIDPRQGKSFSMLNAQTNVSLYKINIPFSVLLTFNQIDFTLPNPGGPALRQSVNNRLSRIGLSPQYKWITTHFGHRNMTFSRYTLNDITFLGAGVEANPGNLRFGAMYGRLAKAEPLDLSLLEPNIPVFERLGYSFKVGYGTESDFIDFIILKAWDDPNSITFADPQEVFAAENAVYEVNARKTLFGKFQLYAEYARSATMDDVDGSPNTNEGSFPGFLFDARAESRFGSAFDGGLDYNGGKYGFGLKYNRITGDFQTFGAYFFNRDIENYVGRANVNLLENRLNLSGSLGLQRDNLSNTKATTINRLIGSANVNYLPSARWNIGLNYSNYNSSINYLLNQELDSLNVVVVTQDLGTTVTYQLPKKGKNESSITLAGNLQNVTDNIVNPVASGEARMLNLSMVYSLRLVDQKMGISSNLNFNNNNLAAVDMNRIGLGVGINKTMFENKLTTGLNLTFYRNQLTGVIENTSNTLQLNTRAAYRLTKQHSFQLALLLMSNRKADQQSGQVSFSELMVNLGYRYNFQWSPFKKEPADAN